MKNNRYTLRCIAPDGAFVTEGEFATIQDAWNRAFDMGSRWFFYPIPIVTGATSNTRLARIVSIPDGMPREWVGKTLGRLSKVFADNAQHVADYCNGLCPFDILP